MERAHTPRSESQGQDDASARLHGGRNGSATRAREKHRQGINQRLTSKEREEWSQQYRTWAEQKLLPQVKEYFIEALPSPKPWELNNIIGTVCDKLRALEGRPPEIHAHLHTPRHEIHDLGQRLRDVLAIQEGTISRGQETATNGPSG